MRLIKMVFAIALGTTGVLWVFCTFIIRVNVVEMRSDSTGGVHLTVDDGASFTDAVNCLAHCKARREWNLRNDIKVKAFWPVTTNEVVNLGCLFAVNHIYPTDTPWEMNGPNGKTHFKWRDCQRSNELMRLEMETRKNSAQLRDTSRPIAGL